MGPEILVLSRLRTAAVGTIRRLDEGAPDWLRAGVRRSRLVGRAARMHRNRSLWEREYEEGVWDRLQSLSELSRYSIIAGYLHHVGRHSRILDVGCGGGAMAANLGGFDGFYVGCDLARPAIMKAVAAEPPRAGFVVADAGALPFSTGSFDVVICNEMLNYLADLPAALEGIVRLIAPGGYLIVSLFDAFGKEQRQYWDQVRSVAEVLDMVALTGMAAGITWRIAVLRPHPRGLVQRQGAPSPAYAGVTST
jgi:2-polyprenyl-3-methyl-5-hydroxy-6-metoxy-1,4-benzoquinol methylase